jgi:tetratricopeptide (TPR) repeat protein
LKHTAAEEVGAQEQVLAGSVQDWIAQIRAILEQDVLQARRLAQQALAEHPDSVELHETLIFTHIRTNDMTGVIALCNAVPREKMTATIFEARGVAQLQLGDNLEALEAFRAASAIRPLSLVADRIGRSLHRLGKIEEAIGIFKSMIEQLKPEDGLRRGAMRQMIYALRDAGRWAEADRATSALIETYRQAPAGVASAIVSTDMEVPFGGWMMFLNKGSLAGVLDAWHARHSDQPRFWPESFAIPGDEAKLAQFRATAKGQPIFAVKPENLYGGQGITLTRNPPATLDQPAVIQRYLDNPYLLNGRKFHARVYVMVTGAHPSVRAYVYREGIARLAPEPYATDDAALARPAVHVTNTALHLKHPGLVVDQDPQKENAGNIWTMSAAYRQMAADGMDAPAVWLRVADLARRFVTIAIDAGIFKDQAAQHTRYAFPPRAFGLDVLIDAMGQPWLIEYQRNPALSGNPLVNRVNGDLCRNILGMSVCTLGDRLDGRPIESLNDPVFRNAIEAEREHSVRGLFERII